MDNVAYYTKVNQELISSTPALLDILYDFGLLPECCVTHEEALYMHAVCLAYKAGTEDAKK